jgi:hypothetical protein
MDADHIARSGRLAQQMAFLVDHGEVDLCGGRAMVFGKYGRPPWRFNPPIDQGEIIRSPSLGFPLLHQAWMGRIEWFRRWRYDESIRLAEDRELLLRSHRNSRFANLPQIVLCYREERITLDGTPLTRCLHAAQSQCLAEIAAPRYAGSKVCRQLHLSVGAIPKSSKSDSSSWSRNLGNHA